MSRSGPRGMFRWKVDYNCVSKLEEKRKESSASSLRASFQYALVTCDLRGSPIAQHRLPTGTSL